AFSFKSAYKILKEDEWLSRDEKWKYAWKLLERVKRELAVDPSCSIYGHESEDILHILKDCTTAKDVWNQIILVSSDEMMGCNNLSIDDWPFGKQIFLNTDGDVQLDSGNAASVEMICDDNGEWIFGHN
ncbi:hypothetical protein Godav_015499, partial [Gossypium davidsonii]|nr:hypothetical protein [Gossypium davidsonii]